jgi:hypothetical protein
VLGAYFLLSFGQVTAQSRLFHAMNMAGALGFVINTWWHGALPSAALNVVWFLIGGTALWRIAKRGSSTSAM